jgi:hypothetical protein
MRKHSAFRVARFTDQQPVTVTETVGNYSIEVYGRKGRVVPLDGAKSRGVQPFAFSVEGPVFMNTTVSLPKYVMARVQKLSAREGV